MGFQWFWCRLALELDPFSQNLLMLWTVGSCRYGAGLMETVP